MERVGRYLVLEEIASGGMATVYLGLAQGAAGFSRQVAVKRLHPHHVGDQGFVSMLIDEAHIAAAIRHPNVAETHDVVAERGELCLIMEYIEGEPLNKLMRSARGGDDGIPLPIVSAILVGVLSGLHAAHEATDREGNALGVVHRDVSPQNVMVGRDGVARVVDFGVAKAAQRIQQTSVGKIKGKVSYMAPEQLSGGEIDRRTDVFAAGVVLWELVTLKRLFRGQNPGEVIAKIMTSSIPLASEHRPDIPAELDACVKKALDANPDKRFQTTREMATALARIAAPVSSDDLGDWVESLAGEALDQRRQRVRAALARADAAAQTERTVTAQSVVDSRAIQLPPRREVHIPEQTSDEMSEAPQLKTDLTGSVASGVVDAGKRKTRFRFIAGAAVALAATAALGVAVMGGSSAMSRGQRVERGNSSAAQTRAPHDKPVLAPADSEPSEADPLTAESVGSTQEKPAPRVPPKAPAPATAGAKPKSTQPVAKSCDPPYTVKDGIRVIKRHCL